MSDPPNMEAAMGAAFRAGWAAACLTIAEEMVRHGAPDLASFFREMANNPAPVQIADTSTAKGQAMQRESREIVMLETIPRERTK
jgi:hypothetical protein